MTSPRKQRRKPQQAPGLPSDDLPQHLVFFIGRRRPSPLQAVLSVDEQLEHFSRDLDEALSSVSRGSGVPTMPCRRPRRPRGVK